MKKCIFISGLLLSFLFIFCGTARAISISASPSPATAGQSVTITVSSSYQVMGIDPDCSLQVNFGDGTSWRTLSACTTNNCVKTISHVYATAGQYTITARSLPDCAPPPIPPDPATRSLTVDCSPLSITSPSTLPQGTYNTAYSYQIQATGGAFPYVFNLTSGALPDGLTLGNTGLISGTPAASGVFNFSVTCTDICAAGAQSQTKAFTIAITCPQLSISSPSPLPPGTVGQAYTYQLQTSGGQPPVSFALASGSLPPGLSLGASGLITGTSSTSGIFNFTVSASDSCEPNAQTTQKGFSVSINPAPCAPLNIASPATLPAGTAGQSYIYQIQTAGGELPVTLALASGSLPQGLNLSAAGRISGTPTAVGSFNFTVTASDTCAAGVQTAQKAFTIKINPAPCTPLAITSASVLPAGTAGQAYNHRIQATGGEPPVTFTLSSGTLPPGLNLTAAGLISGTPRSTGTFNFTIAASDACAAGVQSFSRAFSIVICGDVKVTASPALSRIPRNLAWSQTIFYGFSCDSTASIALNSNRGVFTANSTVIGEVNTPLNVVLTNGAGNVSELLSVPVAIQERAKQAGTQRIIFNRTFASGPITVDAQTEIIVTGGASSDFTITRLQLYFENQRAEITVERNYPALQAYADIRFSGSGLLKGFWEVDGRTLHHVNQHLVYGRSITLSSPEVPPLPTFAPGTHIVRFIVTEPSEDIPVPEAIYFVTAEESEEVRIINLALPVDNAEISYAPTTFEWQNVKWAETYLIVFFGENDEKPVFSAYTKDNTYQIPPFILEKLFLPTGTYKWQVKGYDTEGDIVGESPVYQWFFSE